ncbi:hypothetical protein [Janthinobacterium lividum]|nr:hypothetical protein [Janthinobacterium lividum]
MQLSAVARYVIQKGNVCMGASSKEGSWHEWLTDVCGSEILASKLLPSGHDSDKWEPKPIDLELAWLLFCELRTRVTTQALSFRDGDEATALKSLVDFFILARNAMGSHLRSHHTSALMTHGLNVYLRPFTARWHAQATAGKLKSMDQRFRFRSELSELQSTLRLLAGVMGVMIGDSDATALLEPASESGVCSTTPSGKLRYGVPISGTWAKQIEALNTAETKEILARRNTQSDVLPEVDDVVGLSISGGGIRSATFALGIVEVLARRGILADVDVMSTVSGGGYLGSFISSTLNDPSPTVGLKPGQQPFGRNGEVESHSVRHLRNHSKYLSEGGISTFAVMAFSAAYGVLISLLLVAPLLVFAATIAVNGFGLGTDQAGWIPPTVALWANWIAWGSLAIMILFLSMSRNRSSSERRERIAVVLFVVGICLAVINQLPVLHRLVQGHATTLLVFSLVLPLLAGAAGLWWGAKRLAGRIAWSLLVFVGPLFFLSCWLVAVEGIAWLSKLYAWSPWALSGLLFVYGWLGVNINFASLHLYYRNRLARTYLRRTNLDDACDPQLLSQLNNANKAPLHLLNVTLNVPDSKHAELRGRNADFFTFSKHFCGGPLVGWWPTLDWEKADPHLDLGTAMAISGAAAAPRMGTLTSQRYTTLLAMLNVRLGYWLRKPKRGWSWNSTPGATYFARELSGMMNEEAAFLNLSDGGHLENLGLYELLRRRCRYIIVIDGEADIEHQFTGLLNAIQMAKIDLGVKVEPDLSDLRTGDDRFKRAHFAMARIDYGIQQNGIAVQGLLLVIKLAMTGNEPELLMKYQNENLTFPHQSTAQQIFSEAQFEAYRLLGEHAAEAAFDPLLAGNTSTRAVQWMHELAKRLVP